MITENPPMLSQLFERDQQCTAVAADPLVELVKAEPANAADAFEAFRAALNRLNERGGSTFEVIDAVVELTPQHPTAATCVLEPLLRMTNHENDKLRRQSYRSLGVLGAVEPVETTRVVNIVADGLGDDDARVRLAAMWSLTKLGLAKPGALSSVRDAIRNHLDDTSERDIFDTHTRTIRKYAAEALAADVTSTDAVDREAPAGDPLAGTSQKEYAGWAIQHAAHGLERRPTDHDQIFGNTSVTEGHQLATRIVTQLQQQAENDPAPLSRASILALGYLTPRNRDLQDGFRYLNTVIDNEDSQRSRAASWILDNGPFRPSVEPPVDEIELTLGATGSHTKVNTVGLPHDCFVQHDVEPGNHWATVTIDGAKETTVDVTLLHSREATLVTDKCTRHNLDVEVGETVTVRPTSPRPARKVVLTLPDGVALHDRTLHADRVKTRLALQSFTVGDRLGLEVFPETALTEPSEEGSWGDPIAQFGPTTILPLRVESAAPEDATTITPNTELDIRTASQWETTWDSTEQIQQSDIVVPTLLFETEADDTLRVQREIF